MKIKKKDIKKIKFATYARFATKEQLDTYNNEKRIKKNKKQAKSQ